VRVLWVLKSLGLGGAERMLVELAPLLDGVEVVPVAVAPSPSGLEPALRRAGLEPLGLGARSNLDASWIARLRGTILRTRPDVVFLNGPLTAAGGRLAAAGLGVPTVSWEHGEWTAYHPLSRWANALTAWRDAAAIAVSEGVRHSIAAHPLGRGLARRMTVVPPGVDVEAVRADARGGGVVPAGAWGPVGHLTAAKGVDTLIRAAVIVQRQLPGRPLVLVGDGPQGRSLRALAERLGVEARFLGQREDARAICGRLEVFVVASRSEGSPVAMLEAMALARPIVATSVGGIPELVEDGRSGLLVPAEDPAALAAAVLRVMLGPPLATSLGLVARRRADERDATRVAARLLRVWQVGVRRATRTPSVAGSTGRGRGR
jgi:glycosyltransferase involved in cell wall biosynthesis